MRWLTSIGFVLAIFLTLGTTPASADLPAVFATRPYALQSTTHNDQISIQQVLTVNAAELDISQVRHQHLESTPDASGWLPITQAAAIQNEYGKPLWFYLAIDWDSVLTEPRWLAFNWPFYTRMELYRCQGNQCEPLPVISTDVTGPTLSSVFELARPGDQQLELYMRLTTEGKVAIPMSVRTPADYMNHNSYQLALTGAYIGILVVMMLYNIVLGTLLRDGVYFWYSAYVASTIGYAMTINGVGRALLWGEAIWAKGHLIGFVACFSLALTVQFFRQILQVGSWHNKWSEITRMLVWCFLILAILQLGPHPEVSIRGWDILALFTIPLLVTLGIAAWRRGNPSGLFLAAGWMLFNISSMVAILGLIGVYQIQTWHFALQNVGIALETVLFSFAQAERINRERSQKEQAQNLAVQYLQEAAEARELAFKVEREAKNHLEDQVERRTRELRLALAQLETLNIALDTRSKVDSLTGLANRRHLDETLSLALNAARQNGWPLTVFMGDIDHFKLLNDEHGHSAGDACLMMVAAEWQETLRNHAQIIARYGGEEFVALIPGIANADAHELAETLRQNIEKRGCRYEDKILHVTQSIGVFTCRPDSGADELLKSVDKALYDAKHNGRNRVCYG
ncbi:GGDEF domain-containing protein [Parathalassolituus penaei]|uniref:diguanylate cyclase n=1 Tax=Parathalassolituus penaei TaxID=2997323 RepID=A0A9X3IRX5_9GAMM|nr:GGDEF domain-containing protein [Parathalassolituus penaei]MCY0964685.1 diguanylate cyclase [Parathalassolituus penaei]